MTPAGTKLLGTDGVAILLAVGRQSWLGLMTAGNALGGHHGFPV